MPPTDNRNGMSFQLATSELGLSPYSLLEAAWCLPAILYGVRNKVWMDKYTTIKVPHPVAVLWIEMGFMTATPSTVDDSIAVLLTPQGENIIRMADLFEYEFGMMQQQLEGDTNTHPEKYVRLRDALGYYSATYLQSLTEWVVAQAGSRVLDVGGGSGYYLRKILESDPENKSGILYDKAPNFSRTHFDGLQADFVRENFLEKGTFVRTHANQFDTIILSEVLHCLGPDQYNTLLTKLVRWMTPDAKLFIIEQDASFRMNWRLHDMTQSGFSLAPEMVVDIINDHPHLGLEVSGTAYNATHYALCITSLEVKHDSIN